MDNYKYTKVSISRKKTQLWTLLLTAMSLPTSFFNGIADSISDL